MALSKTSNSCGNIQAVMWQLRSLMIFNYFCSPKNSCWWFQPIWNIWKLWMPLGIIIPIPMVEHHSLIQTKIPTRESLVITAIIYPAIIPGLMLQSPLSWAAPAPRCAASSEASGWAPQVGKTSRGPVAPILAMTCWWHMGIFLGDWWDFFSWHFIGISWGWVI